MTENENKYKMRIEKTNLAYRNMRVYRLKRNISRTILGVFLFVLILGLSFVILYPFIKLIPQVFNNVNDIGKPDIVWIPKRFSIQTFQVAAYLMFSADKMIMVKSLGYSASIALIQAFICGMAGYALARIDFKGRNLLFILVIISFIVPPQALFISQYLRFKQFDVFGLFHAFTGHSVDLINQPITLYLLAIFGFGLKQSLFIFIFRQFFVSIPNELEEAALIDGCGFYKTYFRVMLPNAVPAMMTVLVFAFVWNYGDTYYTAYFDPNGPFLSLLLKNTFQDTQSQIYFMQTLTWNKFGMQIFTNFTFDAIKQAALLIYLAPLIVLYLIIQRRFVENFERSGIVG